MTEILILDYNRPSELKSLVNSIDKLCSFEKKVVVLNNGGDSEMAESLKAEGKIDKLINNPINVGCGLGTIQLFSQCESEYAFYIQVDHELFCHLDDSVIKQFVGLLSSGHFDYVDLAGNQGNGKYSERAQFISKEKYLMVPKEAGGPGPLDCLKWTEESVQDANLRRYSIIGPNGLPVFIDRGYSSVRSNPDGSEWYHFPDTKRVFCRKAPTERFSFPPLNDEEWEMAIAGEWPEEGIVIEAWAGNSFSVWN